MIGSFEAWVGRSPSAVAVVCKEEALTYRELDALSRSVATAVALHTNGEGERVALAASRSVGLVGAVLGILRAGAVYVPLDLEHPSERVRGVLDDAGAGIVLGDEGSCERLQSAGEHVVIDWGSLEQDSSRDQRVLPPPMPDQPAYMMYTSGSTGRPKGVVVSHGALGCFLSAMSVRCRLHGTRVLAQTTVSFDISLLELLLPLCLGGTVVVADDECRREPRLLARYIRGMGVDWCQATPSQYRQLLQADAECLRGRHLVCGGEALPVDLATDLTEVGASVTNAYGPTEATVWASTETVDTDLLRREHEASVSIGRPLPGYRVYVLDETLELRPPDVPGEIYVGGGGVALGYWGQPELTDERFVRDPFSSGGGRLYRTGDIGRWMADGRLRFMGRVDGQVKLRGHRIELGEIEAAANAVPGVEASAATLWGEMADQQRLVLHVVPSMSPPDLSGDRSTIDGWTEAYDAVYGLAETEEADEFSGWQSSYSGERLPDDEMRVWSRETARRVMQLAPSDVLDIGSGTGHLLTRLSRDGVPCIAVERSTAAVSRLRRRFSVSPNKGTVEVIRGDADDLSFVEGSSRDVVSFNSVVQYFPSLPYFLRVIEEAVRVTKPGGRIFLGDIRNHLLLRAFHASVRQFREGVDQDFWPSVDHAVRGESELTIAPALFAALPTLYPRIGTVEFWPKYGRYDNELSRFRYDAVLTLDERRVMVRPTAEVAWDEEGSWEETLAARLRQAPDDSVRIAGIVDDRLAPAVGLAAWGEGGRPGVTMAASSATFVIQHVVDVVTRHDGRLAWTGLDGRGVYDAIVNPDWTSEPAGSPPSLRDLMSLANDPSRGRQDLSLEVALRGRLRATLPSYMMPSSVVMTDALPLTPNGKLNRRALPAPPRLAGSSASRARDQEEEIVGAIMADVLGVPRVGPDDDFFVLGGNSLSATRLVAGLRRVMNLHCDLRRVFDSPTPRRLCLDARRHDSAAILPLEPIPRSARIPMSPGQAGLWCLDQLKRGTEFQIPNAVRIRGDVDPDAVGWALRRLASRHEILRTRFGQDSKGFCQVVEREPLPALRCDEMEPVPTGDVSATIAKVMQEEAEQRIDLAAGPPFRVRLTRLGDSDYLLTRMTHHIASDAMSEVIFNREFFALYDAEHRGRDMHLEALPVQYGDYALWAETLWTHDARDAGRAFWRTYLDGAPERCLAGSCSRPVRGDVRARVHARTIPLTMIAALKNVVARHQASLFMGLLTCFARLVHETTGQEDLVVGSAAANRRDPVLDGLIGFFVNPLALRLGISRREPFDRELGSVRRATLAALQYQHVPIGEVVAAVGRAGSLERSPLFNVTFTLQADSSESQGSEVLQTSALSFEPISVRHDLEVHASETDRGLTMSWFYDTSIFSDDEIECLARDYEGVLAEALAEGYAA